MSRDETGSGSQVVRWVGAVVLTGGMVAGMAVLSLWPMSGETAADGVLLLDWRLRGEETGTCLRAPEEVQESRPAHMRSEDACLGELPSYRLRLRIDGELVVDDQVRGGGFRGDRPLTVYRELRVLPGRRELQAEFFREDGDPEAVELTVRDTVHMEAGRVTLLVRRQDTGVLEVRDPVR